MTSPDIATIQALRLDLALQIARHVARTGSSQVAAAKTLGIPQPTLSRIVNGQVAEVSLELLLRIAVRAQLPVVLQTGRDPVEAGAHVTGVELPQPPQQRAHRSRLSEQARATLARTARQLSPEQRLETQLQHSELMIALQRAGARPARRGR